LRNIVIENVTASPAAVLDFPSVVDPGEAQLVDEVGELWQVHNHAKTTLHQTRDELKRIRTDLSQRLSALKQVLSRPGRGGAWSSFLQAQSIPRSTADRLVRGHEKTTVANGTNCANDQIPEPTEMVVRRYVHALWPRLSRVLTTREAVHVFLTELNRMAEKSFEADSRSLGSSPARKSEVPSYLKHLVSPVIAVSGSPARS
jgi:hypothetical protein